MARPRILTPERMEDALTRNRAGETFAEIADSYGVHPMSLSRARRRIAGRPRTREERAVNTQRTTILQHWITAAQAAVILGISRRSVCELCRRGKLFGALKMGAGAGAVWLLPKVSVVGRACEGGEK